MAYNISLLSIFCLNTFVGATPPPPPMLPPFPPLLEEFEDEGINITLRLSKNVIKLHLYIFNLVWTMRL